MKSNSIYLFLICVLVAFTTCKKDRLSGDRDELVGKWRWVKTQRYLFVPSDIYSTPGSTGQNHSIEFKKCGRFIYYTSNSKVLSDKTRFITGKTCEPGTNFLCYHSINLISSEIDLYCYLIEGDTLIINQYPEVKWYNTSGTEMKLWNVYVRE